MAKRMERVEALSKLLSGWFSENRRFATRSELFVLCIPAWSHQVNHLISIKNSNPLFEFA